MLPNRAVDNEFIFLWLKIYHQMDFTYTYLGYYFVHLMSAQKRLVHTFVCLITIFQLGNHATVIEGYRYKISHLTGLND